MKLDSELLLNQTDQTRGGPEFVLEPMFGGALVQPTPDDLLLVRSQLPWPTWNRPGDESRLASVPERGHPAPHGRRIDPEEIGDLLGRVPLDDALHGETTPVFQFVRCALGSHNRQYTRPETQRALLFLPSIAYEHLHLPHEAAGVGFSVSLSA